MYDHGIPIHASLQQQKQASSWSEAPDTRDVGMSVRGQHLNDGTKGISWEESWDQDYKQTGSTHEYVVTSIQILKTLCRGRFMQLTY